LPGSRLFFQKNLLRSEEGLDYNPVLRRGRGYTHVEGDKWTEQDVEELCHTLEHNLRVKIPQMLQIRKKPHEETGEVIHIRDEPSGREHE